MDHPEIEPQAPAVQDVLVELATRVPGLVHHPGARGQGRHPYASGPVAGTGDKPLEICRSVRWHGHGLALWFPAGPFGAWAKPILPDVDQQEGGLVFLPDTPTVHEGGLLTDHPEAQADLHRLWLSARWEDDAERAHDGLALLVRPDAVVAHLHTSSVSLEALESLVRHLPAIAEAAAAHDAEWSETVHPAVDSILWPALWVVAVSIVVILAYFVIR